MKKFILITLSILTLTGCSFMDNKETKMTTFKSYDDKFQITVPSDWKKASTKGELNSAADFELYNKVAEKYFLALMESKEDIAYSFEQYKTAILAQNEKVYSTTFDEVKDIKIDEHDCNYVEFKTQQLGTNIYMRIYVIETDNYYGQLFIWTTYSQKDKLDEEFDKIISSYKEV